MGGHDDELEGEVAAVVFRNDDSGFGVVELTGPDDAAGARAAGPLSSLVVGQPVRLHGRWDSHHRYGPTFTAVSYELTAPRSEQALVRFLSSEHFPGVGERTAERIVGTYGLDTPEAVGRGVDALDRIPGVSTAQAETVVAGWRAAGALSALTLRLSAVGVPAAAVAEFHRRHGDDAAAVLDDDPYTLLDVPGVGWRETDALGRREGVPSADERRLAAAVVVALRREARRGHTWTDQRTLGHLVEGIVGQGADSDRALEAARRRGRAVVEPSDHGPRWVLPALRVTEERLAGDLARILARLPTGAVSPDAPIPDAPMPDAPMPDPPSSEAPVPEVAGPEVAGPEVAVPENAGREDEDHPGHGRRADDALTGQQHAAVRAALSAPVSVLTGGPGTGKTRSVRAMVDACAAADLNVALCAPTGRAAKRMEELTGHPATTVHRLLEAQPTPSGAGSDDAQAGFTFSYGRERRLPQDVVIVDEFSMADTALAAALVAAVDERGHLVVVGDTDQLPPVGPGAVLRDLLAVAAQTVPRQELTHIHRQAARSRIVTLAHEIRSGVAAPPRGRAGDVYAVPQPTSGLADRVAEIVAVRAPGYFGIEPSDVQVLAPMYRGGAGVDALNDRIAQRLNPPAGRPPVAGLREGDRVVQTRNDTELDVANGEVGEVTATSADDGLVEVAFPAGTVRYPARAARHLRPAWCLTVHKSQGGEWPVVVLVVDPAHRAMLYRELVYTAVTRARTGLIIVGEPALVAAAARRRGAGLQDRRTALVPRLQEALDRAAYATRR